MVVVGEIAEGSSSSSSTHDHQYDVFLSFRGVDTRLSFTDHLYNALEDANFKTFLDDEEIETGEELKPELESAIKASRASIIVLSKNYASSTWCLDELVLILKQNRNSNQIVIPIFYHVEPTHVRKQKKTFGDAMARHKQRMEEETNAEKRSQLTHKMELWKKALSQVADLKGKDANNRKETEFIEEIVTDLQRRLGATLISNSLPLLIGMDSDIKLITSWLTDGSCHTSDIFTITGMSGIGKTSLAKYVFRLHCHTFKKSIFLEDIGRRCTEKFTGLLDLTKQLYENISKKILSQVHDVSVYSSMIENVLARKKVFLVLDDIDSLDQLNVLLGKKGFYPGSKIIITTKYMSLTESCELFNSQVQPENTKVCLKGLYKTEALKLLCTHAFKSQKPEEGYQEVSKELVSYCDGHPLALKVLGESLHNGDVADWEACIEGLKKEPDSRIREALHMSFNFLPTKSDKELFKHIACFFVGADRDVTETILEACERRTRFGIKILIDRCLLSIGWNNELMMHQLIQDLGRDLVRQESPHKLWKCSRLWCDEESFKVLKQKKGKGNILGLALDIRMLDKKNLRGSFELETDSLSRMDNLLLLQLNYVQMSGSYENFPGELRWLCMHGFPLKSIPLDLPMNILVALDMSYSNIESFGIFDRNPQPLESREKLLRSLKVLVLSFCARLHSLGGFLELPVLERLIVRDCMSLLEVCESIEQCVELVLIDMSNCYKLRKFLRSIGKLKKVKTLLLDGCTSLESRIQICDMDSSEILVADPGINSQTSSSAVIEAIPSVLKFAAISLPCSLVTLSLKNNKLSSNSFPNDLSSLSMLKNLYLDGNPIVSMPNCVRSLPRLDELTMLRCGMLRSIEHPPCTLRKLAVSSSAGRKSLLQKIKFDLEMSPLHYHGEPMFNLPRSSFEMDGIVKIQPMVRVDKNILHSLGWTNLEFLRKRRVETNNFSRGKETSRTQMYYEFGIFSTIYEGKEMPNWMRHRSKGSSISFTIPSSSKKLRGLNFCCVETLQSPSTTYHNLPPVKISNITKCQTWIYKHFIQDLVFIGGKCLTYLSHWMCGMNEMESGDQITITVIQKDISDQVTSKCGVRLVYDAGKMEEDALGYYKSWNHIIGGDLSPFQTTTGEYILHYMEFPRFIQGIEYPQQFLISCSIMQFCPSEKEVPFKAFSPIKSDILDRASQNRKNAAGLHKPDTMWSRDRAIGLKEEDISQACEDTDNKQNMMLCSPSDNEEVVMVSNTEQSPTISSSIRTSKKRKKASQTRSSQKKKKSMSI